MLNQNTTLPENLQGLIKELTTEYAVPLGELYNAPFLALKIPDNNQERLEKNEIIASFRPAIFNVEFNGENIAICIVEIKLNQSDNFIYTANYNLSDAKQFKDCYELLQMKKFGLLVATTNYHDFLLFDVNFESDANLTNILVAAREKATTNSREDFMVVSHALRSQARDSKHYYQILEEMAPSDKMFYASMKIDAEKE